MPLSVSLLVIDKKPIIPFLTLPKGDICYIANTGDSRAILSTYGGTEVIQMTRDHKPGEDYERIRITENGGSIYQ